MRRHRSVLVTLLIIGATMTGGAAGADKSTAPGQNSPVETTLPSISGTFVQGQMVSASSGTWSGPTQSYAYQWEGCNSSGGACSSIAQATKQTYTLAAADVGSTIRVSVMTSNKNGSTVATSNATPLISSTATSTTSSTTSTTTTSPTTASTTTGSTTTSTTPTTTSTTSSTTTSSTTSSTTTSTATGSTATSTTTSTTPTTTSTTTTTTTTTTPTSGSNAPSCPAATGTVTYAKPGDDLTNKSSGLTAGNTLVLNNGTYYPTSEWYINGLHGTASAPIIIEAASDGGAVIDGTNTGSTDHLLYVTNSSYVIFCGFELRNAHQSTFVIAGSGDSSSNGDNNNITVERVIAHDAGSGNWDCFAAEDNASGSSYASIRFVDDAGWGRCRYIFIAYHINGVVFQRDWARAAYTTNFSPAPRSSFGVYGSQNVTLENDIGLDTIPNTTDPNWYTAQWQTDNDTINFPTQNTTYLGDMFYNNCLGVYLTDTAGSGTVFRDTYIDVPANSTCQADQGSSYYYPIAVDWGDLFGGTMTNMAIVNSPYGYWGSSGTATITNSVFLNDGIALQGPFLQSYNDLYANGSNGVTLSATDSTASPGYNTSTYGRGAYLMPAPALIGKGNGGADIGAHIIYEYDNSSLTPTPLWPWPMESRIMADTGRSVTYASGGGIWNTLTGVYP